MDDDREGGYFELLKDCIYHLEQPQRMAVDIPHFLLSDHVKRQNYKVVYTGDGADEILAGYDCFRQDSIRLWGNELEDEKARADFYFSDFSQLFSSDYLSTLLRLHEPSHQSEVITEYGFYPVWYDMWQVLKDPQQNLFVGNDHADDQQQMAELISHINPKIGNRHRINQSLYLETKTRLPNWILWKSDRLSMSHGVEARVPFLDHPLVELAARVPPEYKLREMDEKYILKQIVSPYLPHIPGDYKKRGFYTPIKEWFFQERHREQLNRYFSTEKLEQSGLFNPEIVTTLLEELITRPTPGNMNEYYRTMQLEWTLMLVLTSQILNELFIAKEAPCFHDI
jgi:asparagine synthase (glutamine-hydrolysing)